jgi:hypothetical protein
MTFTPLRDAVQPYRDPDVRSRLLVRALSWVMARFIEGFAFCAVGIHPECIWLTDEHDDQTSAPLAGTTRRPSSPDIASGGTVTTASAASQPAVRAAGRHRDD